MKSSLLWLLATTTTVVHGAVCAADATVCNGVCLNNADYKPNDMFNDDTTCKAMASGSKFTNEAQCATAEKSVVADTVGKKCCGASKKSACWVDVAAAVCKNKADYTPNAPFADSYNCQTAVGIYKFTNEAQCTGAHPLGATWDFQTNQVAQKCCGTSKKGACWVDVAAGVCKNKADWTPNGEYAIGEAKRTCKEAATAWKFTDKAQCVGAHPLGTAWSAFTTLLGVKCCGTSKKSACWVDVAAGVCKNKADWTPDATPLTGTQKDMSCATMAAISGMTATAQCGTSTMRFNSKGEAQPCMALYTQKTAELCCGSGKTSVCPASVVCSASGIAAAKKAKEASDKAIADLKKSNPNATDAELAAAGKKAFDASIAESAGAAAPSPEAQLGEGAGHHAGITVAVSILLAVVCLVW